MPAEFTITSAVERGRQVSLSVRQPVGVTDPSAGIELTIQAGESNRCFILLTPDEARLLAATLKAASQLHWKTIP